MSRTLYRPSSAFTHRNKVRLVRGGKEYFSTLKAMIGQARLSFHLQVYIFQDDETGREVAQALTEAAGRGVKIYILADGYASKELPDEFISNLRSAGIHFRFFEPLLKSEHFYFGRRLHHKVAVADGYYSLVGGINISNHYNDVGDEPSWLDWALYAEGEISRELQKVCVNLWTKPALRIKKKQLIHDVEQPLPDGECLVRLRRNDWVKRKNQISGSYVEMLQRATHDVIIMSSYFLPGRIIRHNLSRASKRGVAVSVVVTHESDVRLTKHAERYMYRWLLKRKIRIFEYTRSILHAKLAVSDHKWVTIGSYNVNDISAYASVELNLDVRNEEFATIVQKRLLEIIQNDCVEVTEQSYVTRYNVFARFYQYLSYWIVRMLYYLFTFYFKQK